MYLPNLFNIQFIIIIDLILLSSNVLKPRLERVLPFLLLMFPNNYQYNV
jgi:hypothetical protein